MLIVLAICLITFYYSASLVMSQWTTVCGDRHQYLWDILPSPWTTLMSIRSVAAILKSLKAIKMVPQKRMLKLFCRTK